MPVSNERQSEIRSSLNRAARMRIGTVFAQRFNEEELRFALEHAMKELEHVAELQAKLEDVHDRAVRLLS